MIKATLARKRFSTFDQSEETKEFHWGTIENGLHVLKRLPPTAKSNQNIRLKCFRTNIDLKKAQFGYYSTTKLWTAGREGKTKSFSLAERGNLFLNFLQFMRYPFNDSSLFYTTTSLLQNVLCPVFLADYDSSFTTHRKMWMFLTCISRPIS